LFLENKKTKTSIEKKKSNENDIATLLPSISLLSSFFFCPVPMSIYYLWTFTFLRFNRLMIG
jgi:hypothetical protein